MYYVSIETRPKGKTCRARARVRGHGHGGSVLLVLEGVLGAANLTMVVEDVKLPVELASNSTVTSTPDTHDTPTDVSATGPGRSGGLSQANATRAKAKSNIDQWAGAFFVYMSIFLQKFSGRAIELINYTLNS